jgi:hypothetical protein
MAEPKPGDKQPPSAEDGVPAHVRKGSFLQTARAVAWSFLGIRRSAGLEQDVKQLNPIHVIVAGVIGAALFVLLLVTLVRCVVGSAATH